MSKKVAVAMIGCGGMSGHHARVLKRNADAQVAAACDVKEEIVQNYINNNLADVPTRPQVFTDVRRMLKEVEPDAVFICTPHTLHYEQGMLALDSRCHVFMEKPMVTSADHAYKLARKVKETRKVFVIGYNTPCTPEFNFLRDQIRKKAFGKLELVVGYITQNWLKGTLGTWRQKPELSGGGQAYDSGAHLLNSLCWSVESNVGEVFAYLDNCGSPVDINSSINVRFENGVMASIVISGNCPPGGGTHMAFVFDGGRVEIDGWGGSWIRVFDQSGLIKYPPIHGKPQSPDDNFINAVLGRDEPRTSPANGIVHSELMDAIYESSRTGKPARPKRRRKGS
ncbi:MAG: Gfo/Idh/MocA family oxidoreductase [Planctomycetes bacterium]|nr:Gfo/Idh/MocA family oxidoreductase [Planctomycetota bacterium]